MEKIRKRGQGEIQQQRLCEPSTEKTRTKSAKTVHGLEETTKDPYPDYPRPTPEECRALRDDLLALHGFPREFARYRRERAAKGCSHSVNGEPREAVKSEPADRDGDDDGRSDAKESVLDGLAKTVLSQNTTEVNSERAFASLKSAFPTWEDVLSSDSKSLENAIRCGGLAPTKASCIKNILNCLLEKRGQLCMEYLRDLSVDEVKAELSSFKGIGPKTAACVLMFHLQRDDFPVDTHVYEIAKTIGWVPDKADRNRAYLHLNRRIPDDLKFDINCLLYTHGKQCRQCAKRRGNRGPHKDGCPLVNR